MIRKAPLPLTRICIASAPPRKPVIKIAPRTDVLGIKYTTATVHWRMPSWTSEISDSPSRWISERRRAGKNIFPVLSPIMFAADTHVRTHPSLTIHARDFMRRSLAERWVCEGRSFQTTENAEPWHPG